MLYLDNVSSELLGGMQNRGPFQVLFIVFIGYMFVCALYSCSKNRKVYKSSVLNSVIMITLVLIIDLIIFEQDDQFGILRCMYSIAWIILIFSMDNIFMYLNAKSARKFSIMMGIVFLYTVFNAIKTFFYMSSTYERMLIPSIYISVMFIPWILGINKKLYKINIRMILLTIMVVVTIVSAKRGAIFALLVSLIVYFYNDSVIKKGKSPIGKLFFGSIIFFILLFVIDSCMDGAIFGRFSVDEIKDGSGRGDSNSFAIGLLLNPPTISELFFGFSKKTLSQGEFLGHNDWLTFALKNGLIGAFCFASLFYRLYKNAYKSHVDSVSSNYCALVVVMMLQSIYSTTYNPTIHPIFAMMYIGYAESQIRKYKLGINEHE